ncbi:MAG: leucine--tRNA ligase [Flavipsychrobacter sp.]|nr:leucine--tRNA ligase [Flavipsychrobacter sp.]
MNYDFGIIEKKWKEKWQQLGTYKVSNTSAKPKFYILDMFPYPSGAGLHVGHPLGYIASDIYARYKRLKGFNVLHPMGYDSFGLPAEQYALETGQHPAVTTEKNIARYREQLDNIGFSFDWDREVRTSDAKYYKWTQWIFLQLFHSWYNRAANKAQPIQELINIFEKEGNTNYTCPADDTLSFDAAAWHSYDKKQQRDILMRYRLAYQGYAEVWWCEALGTVLANDEVVNGVSERGGHPAERKKMRQWFLRITEFADRLLDSLDTLDWSEAMKEMQRNWIGKSNGAEVRFALDGHDTNITVFTTRPDTIFGVDFMVVAPEHEMVDGITTQAQQQAVQEYKQYVKSRSERERMAEVKQVTGAFTGAYAINPVSGNKVPVWISEYVLAGYGTGAIMAVPSGDERDHAFAQHFNLSITNIFGGSYNGTEAYSAKKGKIENSGFLTGLEIPQATEAAIKAIESAGAGRRKVNYKFRDAGFSRQRYWGEPFPIIYIDGIPFGTDEQELDAYPELQELPVILPRVESYKPGPEGEGPLANVSEWVTTPVGNRETNTMPGYAASSWYFLRFMDPHNNNEFASHTATDYWNQVDIYIGGTEHAVGHLLYSRMWTKALHDLGHISFDEPFKKLINQGMIQGNSRFVYRVSGTSQFVSYGLKDQYKTDELHVDVNIVDGLELDTEAFTKWRPEYENATFIKEGDKYICGSGTEKMSKSKYNVVNPDDIVAQYGADTFRMYEMFLGPIDISKPWDTKGIEGVHRFLKKLWRLYADEQKGWIVTDEHATEAELRILHKTIKKTADDIEKWAYNTSVSQFMICVNDLTALNCHKRAVLEPLAIVLSPLAPHLAEELWHNLGHTTSVLDASYPAFDEQYINENSKKYPVAVNGKTRADMEFALEEDPAHIQKEVLANSNIQKWMEGKDLKKFIYVKGKMINVVV